MNRTPTTAARPKNTWRASPLLTPRLQRFALPFALFLLALVSAWLYDPFHRTLYEDPGIFALISQLVAQGFAPHQIVFNEQASLTYLLGGAVMWLGNLAGLHPLISFRILSMLVFAGVVVLTYVVGKIVTDSTFVGLVAGFILVSFQGYVARAATALEPKSLMLLFGLGALYFLSKRKWLIAGALASAAGLAWQIAWGYLIVALLLSLMQGGMTLQERGRAFLETLGAALAVFVVYLAFYVAHGAQVEMFQQTFLAPLIMHDGEHIPFIAIMVKLARAFYVGFGVGWVYGILGMLGLGLWLGAHVYAKQWRGVALRVSDLLVANPRTSGTLLAIGGFALFSYLDFQNYPDWFPLLPFISIFAAWFLYLVYHFLTQRLTLPNSLERAGWIALAFLALLFGAYQTVEATRGVMKITWQDQQRVADEINREIPPDAAMWLSYKPELLFFMQRHNSNKYIYLLGRVDAAADAFEPGGFDRMFQSIQNQHPVLYALDGFKARKISTHAHFELVKHTFQNFIPLTSCRILGRGNFYAPDPQAAQLFPTDTNACLHR
jgi:DolP-mannose mannosyltransferase